MADLHVTTLVDASPTEVITDLADLTALPEWDSSVRTAELIADIGPAVGRRFDVTVGFYGRELDAVYELTRFDAGEAVAWSIDGKATGSATVTVSEREGATAIDYELKVTLKGMARLLDRGLGVALEGIGENIERGLSRRFAR